MSPFSLRYRPTTQRSNLILYTPLNSKKASIYNPDDGLSSAIGLEELNGLLENHTVEPSAVVDLCQLGRTYDDESKELLLGGVFDLLCAIPLLRQTYDNMPGATISTRCAMSQLVFANWLQTSAKRQEEQLTRLNRAEIFAAICMLDSGHLNFQPDELERVFAISSGSFMYIAAPLLCDPGAGINREYEGVRAVVGNVGRPGLTLVVPTTDSEIQSPSPENWKLINHARYDGSLENSFQSTSLHFRFTGFEIPVETGSSGSRFIQVSFAEAVISVHDQGSWIADIDIIRSLRSLYVLCLPRLDSCVDISPKPISKAIAIENWEEILDPPRVSASTVVVFKTHGNWQARLAAACICAKLKHRVVLFQDHGCWDCASKLFESNLDDRWAGMVKGERVVLL